MDELQEKTGLDIPIHVDAASGGFVAPFAYPDFNGHLMFLVLCLLILPDISSDSFIPALGGYFGVTRNSFTKI